MGGRAFTAYLLNEMNEDSTHERRYLLIFVSPLRYEIFWYGVERCRKVSDSESLTWGFFGSLKLGLTASFGFCGFHLLCG